MTDKLANLVCEKLRKKAQYLQEIARLVAGPAYFQLIDIAGDLEDLADGIESQTWLDSGPSARSPN